MIGIFDSGMGGLTVMREIRKRLPSADIVYFGDTKNAPYGSRTREDLSRLTAEGLKLLQERGATSIVSACNSVSASLAVSLFDMFDLAPAALIEMVGPTVSYLRSVDARLLLVATQATVESGIYQNAFRMVGKDVPAIAIPELAGALERGAHDAELERIIAAALPGDAREYDALVLACTHYPLALSAFRNVLGDKALLFDPAVAVAERVEKRFWPREAGEGKTLFLISSESTPFRAQIAKLFPNCSNAVEVVE